MAEKPQQTKGKGGAPGAGGGKKSAAPAGATDPAPKSRVGTPRFQTLYQDTIRPRLAKSFGLGNPNQVPRIVKIVLNVGLGEGSKNPKLIDAVADEFSLITGQRPVVTKAKKAIANFNLRQGMPVGGMGT